MIGRRNAGIANANKSLLDPIGGIVIRRVAAGFDLERQNAFAVFFKGRKIYFGQR